MATVRYRAMMFDLDGTLGDTLELIYRAFNDALAPYIGRELSPAEIRGTFGPPDTVIIPGLVDPGSGPAAHRAFVASYEQHHDELVPPIEGMADLVSECRLGGARIAVITGKSRETAIVTLNRLGLMPFVETLFGGDDVARTKPDPMALLLALEAFGIPADDAVMVGDSAADVLAGQAIGCTTIGVLWGSPDHHELDAAGPDYVAATVGELRSLLLVT